MPLTTVVSGSGSCAAHSSRFQQWTSKCWCKHFTAALRDTGRSFRVRMVLNKLPPRSAQGCYTADSVDMVSVRSATGLRKRIRVFRFRPPPVFWLHQQKVVAQLRDKCRRDPAPVPLDGSYPGRLHSREVTGLRTIPRFRRSRDSNDSHSVSRS